MKTKTKKAPEVVAGEGYKQLFAGEVNLANIQVQSNFRKTFNEKLLKELSNNIAKVGVLQPVILRQVGEGFPKPAVDGDFILVAGERRLRAASLAGLTRIPARVLDLNEEQAAEVQALENLHRKDLSPIEEARAFKVLLDQKGHSVEQAQELADRVGKNVSYIYRSVRLLELPKDVLEKIETGEWTPAHGHQLLRVPKDKVQTVLKEARNWDGNVITANDIRKTIENQLGRDLHSFKFPKDIQYAAREACTTCACNSGNQGALFDGAKEGKCTFRECLDAKQAQFVQDKAAELAKEYGDKFLGLADGYLGHGTKVKNGMVTLCKLGERDPYPPVTKEQRKDAYYILEKDLDIWLCGEKPKGRSDSSGETRNTTTPKQKFIRMETYKALFMAARAACAKGLTKEQLAFVAEQLEPGHYNTHLPEQIIEAPMKSNSWMGKRPIYGKMTADQLRDMVLLFALDKRSATSQDPDAKAFTAVGVDVKKVKEIAKKTAEAAWEAKKAAKKAKPAKKGAKPEPEIDSDQDNE
jgi:ParB/RepB/Spo0J family partition protein